MYLRVPGILYDGPFKLERHSWVVSCNISLISFFVFSLVLISGTSYLDRVSNFPIFPLLFSVVLLFCSTF